MKAIVCEKYGSPEFLQLKEVAKPKPKEHEVLVKIHATAVNDYDWSMVLGKPYIYRLMFGILKPKNQIPGMELSGEVEAIGENVSSFKVGDEVYGDISGYGFGSFAEYVCIDEKALIHKPDNMSFEEATSIPHAAMLAYQGLCEVGKIQKGQKVLINGAGGGVGSFGLQIAKLYGAEVTGVDSLAKLKMMRTIGFDHVIDYKKKDFTKMGKQYDLILDTKTNRMAFQYLKALRPNGKYVTVGGNLIKLLLIFLLNPLITWFGNKTLQILALKPNEGLGNMNKLFENRKLNCVIDGPYTLEELPKAIQYFGEGRHKGKVVINLNSN